MAMDLMNRSNGKVVKTVTTIQDGRFRFPNVCPGDYAVMPRSTRRQIDMALVGYRAWHPETQLVTLGHKPVPAMTFALQPVATLVHVHLEDRATGETLLNTGAMLTVTKPDGSRGGRSPVNTSSGQYHQCCGRYVFHVEHPEYRFTNIVLDIQPNTRNMELGIPGRRQ